MLDKKKHPVGKGMKASSAELGKFLKARRLKLKLTQIEVCKYVGLEQSVYSLIESCKKENLKKEHLQKFSEVLKCSLQELERKMPEAKSPETELGKFIRARRAELKLSISDFAEKLGMSEKKAKLIELKKTTSLHFKTLLLLANALNLEISAFSKFAGKVETESVLGQLVRTRRIELGLSARDLAKKIGKTHQAINNVELGSANLQKDEAINSFAKALDLDVELLKLARRKENIRVLSEKRQTPMGKYLTKKRLEMDLSQGEVAALTNITVSTISILECGYRKPNLETLLKICEVLKCEIPTEAMLNGNANADEDETEES